MTWLQLTRAQAAGTSVFSKGYLRELSRQDRLWLLPLALAGMAVGVGSVVWMLLQNYRGLFLIGRKTGHPELLFFFSLLASGVFIFILSIPTALSRFYHSRDADLLSSLPVTPRQMVLSKTGLLYLFFLLLHLVFFLPAVYVYLLEAGRGAVVVTAVVLQALAVPLAPLVLGILAAALLAGVSVFSRHRVLFEVLGMLIVVAGLVALQALMSRQLMGDLTAGGQAMDPDSFLVRMTTAALAALPPAAWAAKGLTGSPLFLLLSLAFTAAVSTLGLGLLSSRIPGILSNLRESSGSRRVRRRESSGRAEAPSRRRDGGTPTRTPLAALFSREWAILSSNSSFLFEAIGEAAVLPIILVVFSVVVPGEIIGMAVGFLEDIGLRGLPVFILILMFTSINSISSTSLSREGQLFSLSLTLPLPGRVHLTAKMLFHLVIFLPALAVDIIVLYILLDLGPETLLYLVPGGMGAVLLNFSLTVAVDLKNPMLSWSHPQQAMKQNLNTLIGMGLAFLTVIIAGGAGAGLFLSGISETFAGLAVAAVLIIAALPLTRRAFRLAERSYTGGIEMAG